MSKGSGSNRNMPNGARRNQVGNISEDRAKEILDSIGLDVNIKDYDSISLVEKDDAYDLYLNGENGIERREIGADSIPYDFEDYMDDNNAWTLNIEKKTKETDIKQIPIKKRIGEQSSDCI